MSTRFFRALPVLASLLAALAFAPAQAQQGPVDVKDYDVFVDLPTAFAFIKLPTGWKFIGKLDADQLRHLPAETLTSLLPADEPRVELASNKSPRKRGG
jgi:hypothetical protein